MKHTIKLLTLAFMLATILTLTGCPGPVNTVDVWDDGVVTTEPTCTTEGVKTYTCSNGETRTETIPALGHDFGEWEITKSPTCTEKGSKTRKCSRCDETETVEIDALGHDWELESDTSTCTEDGVKTYKCSRCNETRTEDITAHHTFIAGGCDKCGAFEHNETNDYQIVAYVYTSLDDAKADNENRETMYFSFPKNVVENGYITFVGEDPQITITDFIHLKSKYRTSTVKYFAYTTGDIYKDLIWEDDNKFLKDLDQENPIYIVIE